MKDNPKLVRHIEGLWFQNEEIYQEWLSDVDHIADKLPVFRDVQGHVVTLWELDFIDTMSRLGKIRVH